MKALEFQAIGRVQLVDVPLPSLRADELLIRMRASTVCTSDLNDFRSNPFGIALPIIAGHEASGTVVAAGAGVTGFAPGDRVATHPVQSCGACASCRRGLAHLCEKMEHFGFNRPGTFAEYFTVRQDRARRLPADLDFATAALAEPVAVCLESLHRARLKNGDRLLILGDGPFGILMARLAQKRELAGVVIAGHHDNRLAFAHGAIRANTRGGAADLRRLAGDGFDAAILAVGSADACALALELLRARGRLVIFSAIEASVPLDLMRLHTRELEIAGACNDEDFFDEAVTALSDEVIGCADLITHRFALENYAEAFAMADGSHGRAMKVAFIAEEEP
ncbi:MAG: alcohol dehydrogenase catalytic domain-containing protein [Verrucomicrobiota bacterium]